MQGGNEPPVHFCLVSCEMNYRSKLFFQSNPYDTSRSKGWFFHAVKENLAFQIANCEEYAKIAALQGFHISELNTEEDLYKIPVLPTLYFKRNRLFSMPENKLRIQATSSGTTGTQSVVAFDGRSLMVGIGMIIRFFSYHGIISAIPANYIMLGYEPGAHTRIGAVMTAHGATKFAPTLHREYALKHNGTGYEPNIEGIAKALKQYARQGFPVRFVGFPHIMFALICAMRENGISLKMNPRSKVLLGGGWKHMRDAEVSREQLLGMIGQTLGIRRENCLEFFSAAEHPIAYCKCENGHFHVPAYSRVIIRDVISLKPVPNGEMGLLSFVTPLVMSMPLISVATDDLAVLYDGESCGCKIKTPYFELMGRAGVNQIKTCAAEAAEKQGGETL